MAGLRRSNPERRAESQDRILDAAEVVFAQGGFNGATIKDVARAADVDSALLHYYFATKAGLYAAVLARRAPEVNGARLKAMTRYVTQSKGELTVAGIVGAYVDATFELALKGGDRYRHYLTVIAQANSTPAGTIPVAEATPFDEVVQVFINLLRQASPDSSDADLYWFYHMLSGAITLSWARTGRIDRLSGGVCKSTDFKAIAKHMVAVFEHGLGI